MRLDRTKPLFSPHPNNFIIRPVVSRYYYSLLISVIIADPPAALPLPVIHSPLSPSLPLSSLIHLLLTLSFPSLHTYSWCSNSQSIRCPKHIKYGSTCSHACWKFIVLHITWIPCEVYQSCHAERTLAAGTHVSWEIKVWQAKESRKNV